MRSFITRRPVSHSPASMFALTADIERYPEFVPLCRALTIRRREVGARGDILIADMTAAYKSFAETFTSKVVLDRANLVIETAYLDGPFRHLANRWRFEPDEADGCIVEFFIEYEFRNMALQLVAGAVFDTAFRKFAEAFEARADAVYGRSAEMRPLSPD